MADVMMRINRKFGESLYLKGAAGLKLLRREVKPHKIIRGIIRGTSPYGAFSACTCMIWPYIGLMCRHRLAQPISAAECTELA
jgi:hypothetical protein